MAIHEKENNDIPNYNSIDDNNMTAHQRTINPLSIDRNSSPKPQQKSCNQSDNDENAQARNELWNFVWMTVLFGANHGCVLSCLALATSQLGAVGAWQSGILYFTYTASGILGSTFIIKTLGSRNALILGMGIFCTYVGCFWLATQFPHGSPITTLSAYTGAIIGGLGGGLIWTAQGVYYSRSAELYTHAQLQHHQSNHSRPTVSASCSASTNSVTQASVDDTDMANTTTYNDKQQLYTTIPQNEENQQQIQQQSQQQEHQHEHKQEVLLFSDVLSKSNSFFAAIFAFVTLAEEVALKALSSFLLNGMGWSWSQVFATYTMISTLSTILMVTVRQDQNERTSTSSSSAAKEHKWMAAWNLLWYDPKMKYMIGLNMIFGLTSAFLNSYVNGEVIQVVLQDDDSKYVGIISSWVPITAAIMSLIFHQLVPKGGKKNGWIIIVGIVSFMMVVIPFMIIPPPTLSTSNNNESDDSFQYWGWTLLLLVFTFHGVGRSTFESTLKATFADFFPLEKEGAFANIIVQNGLSSTIGYILTFHLACDEPSTYCVPYRDGSHHDVLSFELLVLVSGILGILGYWRASYLHYYQSSSLPSFLLSSSSSSTTTTTSQT